MAKRSKLTFDLQELEELLKSFHLISNTRIAIFDDEFQKIIAYPKEHLQYCQILREGKNIKEECKKNDLWGCKCCKEKRDVFQYTCHAGLQEVVLPLWDGDIIIGYLMLGQIVLKKDNESAEERWQTLKTRAEQYHIDVENSIAGMNPSPRYQRICWKLISKLWRCAQVI
ncbi:MAG: PocR ligand-binding domain-containing protein [Eubacteriales bacterium]|nr:PocR ligand-binding domain-containing protein [Eubacteriales bacterium]